jgi:2-keto-4-pentenoate hydratase/2-oxohepta-3-ene-1,7-dioic acid hydratase in catechol pathway
MAFSFAEMIAYASRGTEVRPGDILGSGTCGNGCLAELWGRNGFDAHPPLRPGDVVTVTVEQLGSLTSRIAEGAEPIPIASARRGR